MHCERCEELLFERIEGTATDAERGALAAHLSECQRCRQLEATLAGDAMASPPDDLTATILALTSARPPLQRALRQLDLDLPATATLDPGRGFVDAVLAATVEADRRRLTYRLRSLWQSLVRRPRFALEGAYVGAVVAVILVGLPGSPLASVPDRVLDGLRQQDGIVRTAVNAGAERLTGFTHATWTRAARLAGAELARPFQRVEALAMPRSWLADAASAISDFWSHALATASNWTAEAWRRTFSPAGQPNGRPVPTRPETTRPDDDDRHSI